MSGGGSITGAGGLYTPADVDADTSARVRCTVTARGNGNNALDGSSDTSTDTEDFTVTVVVVGPLPAASAPAVTVGAVGNVNEGATQQFTRALAGGTYDELDEAWSVVTGGGSINSSGLFTAPQVSDDTAGQVRLTVTARGTGGIAHDGTSAQASDAEVFTVVNVVVLLPPGLPQNLENGDARDGAQDISWDAPVIGTGPFTYDIEWATNANGPWTRWRSDFQFMGDTLSSLEISTTYYWRVRARNDAGESDWAVENFTTPDTEPVPTPPVWSSENSGPAQNWVVGESITPFILPLVGAGVPAPAYVVTGLPPGVTNSAFGSAGSTVSGTPTAANTGTILVTATNSEGSDIYRVQWTVVADVVAPGVPRNLGTTILDADSAIVEWDAPLIGTAPFRYRIEYATESNPVSWTLASDNWLDDDINLFPLDSGTTYYWRVRAENDAGESDYASSSFTTLGTPSLPDAVAPAVAVGAVGNVNEGATQQFTRALSGGTYDELDEAWSVISGGGSVNSSGLYTAPQVSFDTTGQVRLTVTARGTGGIAQDGTSAQFSDTEVFTVVNVVGLILPDPDDLSLVVGTAINILLPAAAGGAGGYTYAISSLSIAGIGFSASTRRLTGTPTTVQTDSSVRYQATDDDGDTATQFFTIAVEAASVAPVAPSVPLNVSSVVEEDCTDDGKGGQDCQDEITSLSWEAPSTGTPPFTYELSNSNSAFFSVGSALSYNVPQVDQNASPWRVRARNAFGVSDSVEQFP